MIRKLLSLTAAATAALASITIILAGPLVAQEWKLMRNENGIRAYARSIPGSKLLELKAITIIDAKMEVIGEVLRDVPSNPEWMADCSDARIVHLISPKEMIVHTTLDFPAPVSDRDLVVRSFTTYLLDRARGIVTLTSVVDPAAPERSGVVRMTNFSGEYVLEYISRDKTGVIYSYRADPGGNIPTFLVNLFSRDGLFKTLTGLKRMAKRQKYVDAALRSPDRALFENTLKDREKVRGILKNRLLERIRDRETVDYVIHDNEVFRLFTEGDGSITGKIFLSWGSYNSVRDSVKDIMRIHLKKYSSDAKAIECVANDESIIASIIRGRKAGEPPVMERVKKKLAAK